MARYKCSVCGFVYDEEKEGRKLTELEACPACRQPKDSFRELMEAAGGKVGCAYRYMETIQPRPGVRS